jgi:hypothetical protein
VPHLALLGDSIFDNAAYVGGGPAVIDQVRGLLPAGWRASLLAVDGSVTADVIEQLRRLPGGVTHLVVSAGGNDALLESAVLSERTASMAVGLRRLASLGESFEARYRGMVTSFVGRALPTALCTIYYPAFPDPELRRITVAALATFNDCIIRVAIEHGLPLVDLRLTCDARSDYANPIEPSAAGGAKIARAITRLLAEHEFERGRTAVFT